MSGSSQKTEKTTSMSGDRRIVDRPIKEPVRIENSSLHFPHAHMLYASEYSGPILLEYDSYGPPYGEEPEEYSRNFQYENLRIGSVNLRLLLSHVYNCPETDIPAVVLEHAESKGWGSTDYWNVEAVNNYYGEEAELVVPENFLQEAQEMLWLLPNAVDDDNVLPYVRSKGVETEGLTPLEALKAQLLDENNGIVSAKIQNARFISSRVVSFDSIRIPSKRHYDEVTPRRPVSFGTKESAFVGVVYPDRGGFTLLDGYHRLKYLKEKVRGRVKGRFIVVA